MKKTLIALAAVAAVSASYAQVTLTGSLSVATQSTLGGAKQGLAMTDNTFVLSAAEDLGQGMKLSAKFVVENDTARGSAFTRADQSIALSSAMGSLAFVNTRSGGNQAAALVAPVNLDAGTYNSTNTVITRSAIDVVAVTVPLAAGLAGSYKYVESGDGAATPAITTNVLGLNYVAGPLTVTGAFNQSTFASGADVRTTSTDLSVVYNAGVATVGFGYDAPRRGKANGTDEAATMFGVSVPAGAASFGLNYGKRDKASFTQVGAQYDLSKRTNVNLSFQTVDTGAATSNENRLSLNHSF